MAKIMLDPGHGGKDPGAIGAHSKEAHNVLKVALVIKAILEKSGHTVRLTRSNNDTYLSLSQRANLANAWKADIFVSLHDNSAANKTATGFETFIFNGKVSNNTVRLQNALHAAVAPKMGIRDRGKKRANFGVLRESAMPAVLFEYAFISNPSDESILINEVQMMGETTAKGINDYFGMKTMTTTPPKPQVKPAPDTKPASVKVGDLVKIKGTATTYANVDKQIPAWAKNNSYTVEKMTGQDVLIKEIKSWVRLKDVELVRGGGGALVITKPAAPKPSTTISRALRYGHKGNDVLELQKLLIKANFYPNIKQKNGGADGHFGKDTQNAVRRFQSVYLPREVDGIAGTRTITKLRSVAK